MQQHSFLLSDAIQAQDQSQLGAQFEDIMRENETLAKENRLLESFLHRNQSKFDELMTPSVDKILKRYQGRELSLPQRQWLSGIEFEFRSQQLAALESKATEDASLLRALIKGVRLRVQELEREAHDFRREIVQGAVHPVSSIFTPGHC